MPTLPALSAAHALFLDFDGTLAELAPRPEAVRMDPAVVPLLRQLHAQLGGALAIVTGRREADIDGFLSPLRLPLASEHGAQYRCEGLPPPPEESPHLGAALAPALAMAQALAAQHPGLLVESKRAGFALHYRLAPTLQTLCHATLERALHGVAGAELLHGKCVWEVKPQGSHKGQAIADFMGQAPFAGRIPVFAGDDTTDERGFTAVQALDGWGIKVGAGDTRARYRCRSVGSLRAWLLDSAAALATAPPHPAAALCPPPGVKDLS